jgi:glycine betaine/choline ABC-type transport system substrate-binding protein
MRSHPRLRVLLALIAAVALVLGIAACGDDDEGDGGGGGTSANLIEENPDNNGIEITVGSKNFTEEFVLGEIYAQALEAAGYEVKKDLNLGDETVTFKALEEGEIDAYPEYTSTILTSLFEVPAEDVPNDADQAAEDAQTQLDEKDVQAFAPTPFTSANAVGLLTSTAEDLGVSTNSDLEGKSQDLVLAGSPECRQRIDCLLGLEQNYGLEFKQFTPVDIGLRYEVLDKGDADLSILFTTDAQLFTDPDKYTVLDDDKQVLPAGNVLFIARNDTVDQAGTDLGETIEKVQEDLSEEVMQELNARVDIDKEKPEDAAREYLQEYGYVQ